MQYKTRGIILRRTNLGEADRILTIFTKNHGKVKAIAKGVRKTLSRLAGHLEPFCVVDLGIAEGRNLDIITDAEVIKCYFKLRSDLDSTNFSYYLAEIIDKMTEENEAHPEIYSLLEETLENINSGSSNLLLTYFELNFLSESGFRPELYKCIRCGKKVSSNELYFSSDSGGLVCGKCQGNDRRISEKAVKVLRLFLEHKISILKKIKTDRKLIKEVETLVKDYLKHISQREFKSARFLK